MKSSAKNRMNKKLSFFLVLLLLLSLCACSGGNDPLEQGSEEEPKFDFGGTNYVILQESDRVGLFYGNNTVNSDYIVERIHRIEQEYNCTLELSNKFGGDQKLMDAVTKNESTGRSAGEMAYTINSNMASVWAKAGYLLPFSDVSDIIDYENESEKYGSTSLFEIAMYNSEVYQVYPVALPDYIPSLYSNCLFAVNEGLIKQAGLSDPREDVEKGSWNWDTFEKRLEEYTYGTGEEKVFGAWIDQSFFLINAALSNGVRYMIEEEGKPVSGFTADKTIEAIDWVKRLLNDKKDNIIKNTENYWSTSRKGEFFENRAMLSLMDTSAVSGTVAKSDAISEFGVVPFPCGPSGEYGKWTCELVSARGMSLLLNSMKEAEDRAVILSELFEPFEEYPTQEDIAVALLQSTYYDKRDVDLMLNLYKGGQYFYWTVGGDEFWNQASSNLEKQSGVQIYEANIKKHNRAIEQYVLPNYDYISTH